MTTNVEKIRFSITRLKQFLNDGQPFTDTRDVEKIRFSITRLKQGWTISHHSPSFRWKDKILDYEIET